MSPVWVGVIVAAFTVMATAMIGVFVRLGAKGDARDVRLTEIEKTISRLDTQVSPFWAAVQAKMSGDLHHPHTRYKEMDGLLEKLESLTITSDERVRLNQLLVERSHDMHPDITDDQRAKATVMIQVMAMVVIEAKKQEDDAAS